MQPLSRWAIFTILLMYALSGVILLSQVGPWTAVRHVLINGLVVFAWLWSADTILGDETIPERTPIRRPRIELLIGLILLLVAIVIAATSQANLSLFPGWIFQVVTIGGTLALFIGFRYPLYALGLSFPSRRGWLTLGAVVTINFAAAALFKIVPQDQPLVEAPGDLAREITGIGSALLLIFGLLVRAALPEELLLRVTLQPRLARYAGAGWAILIQAALFSAGHLPQHVIGYQEPFPVAIGSLLALDNGLIAGYLWYRTHSLPLLLLLHLFAFPRFGI